MQSKKMFNRIVNGLVIGSLLFTSGGVVLADDATTSADTTDKNSKPLMMKKFVNRFGNLEEILDKLVTDGTITQDQVDQLKTYMKENAPEKKDSAEFKNQDEDKTSEKPVLQKHDILADVVAAGIITQEQADAVKDAMQTYQSEKQSTSMQERLDKLVEEGKITSEQSEAILEAFENISAERKATLEKIKDMTQEERQAYLQEHKSEFNPWQQLVEDGVLTQDQLDAMKGNVEKPQLRININAEGRLNQLVEDGKLTSEQSEAILEAIENLKTEGKAALEAMKDMTREERQAYMKEHKSDLNIGDKLVESGVITQDQLDELGFAQHFKGIRLGGQHQEKADIAE